EGLAAVVEGAFEFALAGGDDAESDAGFGVAHGGELVASGAGADPDDFGGLGFGKLVLGGGRVVAGGQGAGGGHGGEGALGGVDGEVVIEVRRVGQPNETTPSRFPPALAELFELASLEYESQQVKPDGDKEIKRHDHAVTTRKPKNWRDVETVIGNIARAWI